MKVFIDANILIDIITERELFYAPAASFMTRCVEQNYEMIRNIICISNAHYLSQKIIRDPKITKSKIAAINAICRVEVMNQNQLNTAFKSKISDFEDALHDACAVDNNCTHIISRNRKGFKKSQLKLLTPLQFLK